jgi:hypothetical protein
MRSVTSPLSRIYENNENKKWQVVAGQASCHTAAALLIGKELESAWVCVTKSCGGHVGWIGCVDNVYRNQTVVCFLALVGGPA